MIRQPLKHTAIILGSFIFTLLALALPAPSAYSADVQMEIFFLPHPPALAVVNKVEKVAAEFKNIDLKKYNFDDPGIKKLLKKYDLAGHMPVAIFINGQNRFIVNGQKMALRNFPKGDAFVPTFAGEWDYEDLRTILQGLSGGK